MRGLQPRIEDLVGKTYHHLTILGLSVDPKKGRRGRFVLCRCNCGKEKPVALRLLINKKSYTRSCGCLKRRPKTHGKSKTTEYVIWASMLSRCQNRNTDSYKRYGERGISVCSRWRAFKNFYADMGARPSKDHTLDRIDNNGNYEPINCRWASKEEQRSNTRRNVILTHVGKTMTATQWARELGVHPNTIYARLRRGFLGEPLFQPRMTKKTANYVRPCPPTHS